jgi:hypothetical protein
MVTKRSRDAAQIHFAAAALLRHKDFRTKRDISLILP